jgi:hypothetical protein
MAPTYHNAWLTLATVSSQDSRHPFLNSDTCSTQHKISTIRVNEIEYPVYTRRAFRHLFIPSQMTNIPILH